MTFERKYLDALRAENPARALRALARDRTLPADVRQRLARVDVDGVHLTALLVAKLRFERLLNGSTEAAAWFERDPRAFTAAFGRYHREVAQHAFFPKAEARAFTAWLTAIGTSRSRVRKASSRRPARSARP